MAIKIKPSHKGLLHKDLGVPAGKPIPAKKLASAAKSSDPAERKRAVFAENAKGWAHRADGGRVSGSEYQPADDFPDADAPARPVSEHPAVKAIMDTARAAAPTQPKASQSEDDRRAKGRRLMSIGIRG